MKRFLSVLLFFMMAVIVMAQVTFTSTTKRVSPTEVDIIFTGNAAKGWHIYSNGFGDGGPTQATFNIDSKKGVELVGALRPGSGEKTVDDPIFGMRVKWFEGHATFTQRVRLTAKDYDLQAYLQYGACNDESCLPPAAVEVRVKGNDGPAVAPAASTATPTTPAPAVPVADPQALNAVTNPATTASVDTAVATASPAPATTVTVASASEAELKTWYKPVIQELKALGSGADLQNTGLLTIFGLGFLGGLVALFTPCVWPIIPMTVSFFLKRSKDRKKGIRDAITYGLAIIVIYVSLGLLVTTIWDASTLNDLSTNAVFNIIFFLMLVIFGASFLGGFEITLPSSWSTKMDEKASNTTGLLSIFFMAFTLSLVSFSCTGPIIGLLLVQVSTNGGSILAPTMGMLGFAVALALPFTLFALFPAWLKSAPKSGGWMNTIKVVLGFLELALSLKFLSVADLAYGWGILDRETFLALWIALFALLGVYLLGKIRFPHDDETPITSVPRTFLAILSFAFAIYMLPGLWGAPTKAVSAFAPPMSTQDFNLDTRHIEPAFKDYDAGMAYARSVGKPVMIDFTGFGCVNCRKMEAAVWHDARVHSLLTKDYVLISLYVDDKTKLPEPIIVQENGKEVKLRTIGDKWSYFQRTKFGAQTQPFYVLLDNTGLPLTKSYSYDENIDAYLNFLNAGLKKYRDK